MIWYDLGSRDGAVVRALASHQCGPGSIPAQYHMWFEFVVGSFPCSEGFSPGSPVSSLHKNRRSKFQFDLNARAHLNELLSSSV